MAKVTKRNTNQKLSAPQQKALNELLSGKTDGEAAEIAGVSRKTVNTWKNDNPVFQAEFNRCKLEVWENFLSELNLTVGDSMATIRQAIKDGDVKTARWFFDKLGFGDFICRNISLNKPRGATDPEEVRKDNLREKAQKVAREHIRKKAIEDPDLLFDLTLEERATEMVFQELNSAFED
jgi:hypothetical protein